MKLTSQQRKDFTSVVQSTFKHFPENESVTEAFEASFQPLSSKLFSGNVYVTKRFICFVGRKKKTYVLPSNEVCNIFNNGDDILLTLISKKRYTLSEFNCDVYQAERALKKCVFGNVGDSPIHEAVKEKAYQKVRDILTENPYELLQYNLDEQTPLHTAIILNDLVMVRTLLNFYAANPDIDINHQYGKQRLTVLHTACSIGKINVEIIDSLLSFERMDINCINTDENTALHYFCSKTCSIRCDEIVSNIISLGGDVNAVNTSGETPLHRAVFNYSVRVILVDALVNHGAQVNCQNKEKGDSPLHYATRLARRDLVEKLISAGADISLTNSDNNSSLDIAIQLLEEKGGIEERAKLFEIIKMFEHIIYLNDILSDVGLEEYLTTFVKEQLYELDVISTLDKNNLMNPPLSLKMGAAIKLLGAIKERSSENYVPRVRIPEAISNETKEIMRFIQMKEDSNFDVGTFSDELQLNENLLVTFEELEFTEKLGSGTSGQVLKGLYNSNEVAIKILTASNAEVEKEEFKKELQIMMAIQSPYLVKLLGASLDPLCIVMEYCEKGSLHEYLLTSPSISWNIFLSLCADMTRGLTALHDLNIIHRDFKSLNLLLTVDMRVKVCDFGLSRNSQANVETFKRLRGTLAYCAPEVFNGEMCTKASDVYSFGIVLWELLYTKLTGKYQQPFVEFDLVFDFQKIVQSARGLRPNLPIDTPNTIAQIYLACVSHHVVERPIINHVADAFTKMKTCLEEGDDSFIVDVSVYPKFKMEVVSMPDQAFQGWDAEEHSSSTDSSTCEDVGFQGWDEPTTGFTGWDEPTTGFTGWDEPTTGFTGWGDVTDVDFESDSSRTSSSKVKKKPSKGKSKRKKSSKKKLKK